MSLCPLNDVEAFLLALFDDAKAQSGEIHIDSARAYERLVKAGAVKEKYFHMHLLGEGKHRVIESAQVVVDGYRLSAQAASREPTEEELMNASKRIASGEVFDGAIKL